ncbi:MAG TPA: hypothetical protein VLH35_05600 [Candidatus Acidoferrales bacterium]|nr:hypothetical protein [Candidatus Acidoferrales bacterium]
MKRYIKYSKNYRKAILCLAIGLASLAWVMAAATFFTSSSAAVYSAFFVPSISAISLFLSIKYWYKGEHAMYGWYGVEANKQNPY